MREINKAISERVTKSLTGKIGDKSRRWKGEKAGYVAKHMWILKHHGKAEKCELDSTHTAKRYEWANISGEYLRDKSDYMSLCPSCHRKMDSRSSNICKHGHEFTQENTYIDTRGFRQCKSCMREANRRFKENAKVN